MVHTCHTHVYMYDVGVGKTCTFATNTNTNGVARIMGIVIDVCVGPKTAGFTYNYT